jgi:hypothetical protein
VSHGYYASQNFVTWNDFQNYHTVQSLSVPGGTYMVNARFRAQTTGASQQSYLCELVDSQGNTDDFTYAPGVQFPPPGGFGAQASLQAAISLSASGTISVQCETESGAGGSASAYAELMAVQVNSVN